MSEADILLASLLQASDDEIEGYKQYIDLPEAVAQHAHFSASNRMGWVNLDKYGLFLRDKRDEQKDASHTRATPAATATAKTSLNPQALKRPSAEVIEISDDDSDAPAALLPPPKKKVKHVKIKAEPIDPLPPTPAPASNPLPVPIVRKYNKDGRIIITTKESVARVVQLDCIPPRWPVEEDTAYVINLSHSKTGATFTGRPKGLDALLKSEDQDSWGRGTNGSTSQPVKLAILDDIPARRSSHDCNGGLRCEFFDEDIFDGYQRRDSDMSLMQELFAQDREQNKNDSSSTIAVTASFHRYVEKMKCKKKDCTGRPVLKLLRKGESDDGKTQFIGCSKWQKNQEFDHLYAALPSAVDEAILSKYMTGQAVESDDVDEYDTDSCAHFIHPHHGKQKACPHTHFRNGELLVGKMVAHRCPVKKIVYTSKDDDIKMLVLIFRGLHSHPPWPLEKPNQEAKEDLARCLDSMGTFGTTGGKLNNSTTTRALLGTDLSTKHASYRDKRRLRDAVLSKRDAATPAGLTWAGIIDQFQQDLGLPLAEQYIHVVRMEGKLKLAVCVDPELGELIHEVRYLVPDFTFKRVVGELNEWEVAVWLDSDRERVSIGRVYCNRATKLAFTYIFDGFFMAIEKVTGRPVRFKAFDPEGNILSIHFDMEAAQVQGFAASLLKLIKGRHPETDPDVIVRYVLKLCSVHFMRSTDALVGAVGQETVDYLNRIRGLRTPEDIAKWHDFCRNHENKKLRDWYEHKIRYSWLLPGYNESLSLFPPGFWIQTPNHTNLVESAHVATNDQTGTKLMPLEAIQRARAFDRARAESIHASRETCIPVNRNNSDTSRMQRSVSRAARRKQHRTQHSELENNILEKKKQLKELQSEKKGKGRAPRNSHSIDRYGTAASIPRVSSALASDDDSEVEFIDDAGSSAPSQSRPSSSMDYIDVDAIDYQSDRQQPDYFSAPPSSSSGFDLVSRASDFDSELEGTADWDATMPEEDADSVPHVGYYLLGAPGFDLDEFLAACGSAEAGI